MLGSQLNKIVNIKVVGVGGAGNNFVSAIADEGIQDIDFIAVNTDAQALALSKCETKIILGKETTRGFGAGSKPEVGAQAAIESTEEIKDVLNGADLVFIGAGMGGGTGTGAAPVIAKIANEMGALVIAVVVKPFSFEGTTKFKNAQKGLEELKKYTDSVIIMSNDKLLNTNGGVSVFDAMEVSNKVLSSAVRTITEVISAPSFLNVDFADIKTVMSNKGEALFGVGIGSGPEKAKQAVEEAISSPLLDVLVRGAKDVIVSIVAGDSFSLNDSDIIIDTIKQAVGSDDLNIKIGLTKLPELNDEVLVRIIATGFEEYNEQNTDIFPEDKNILESNQDQEDTSSDVFEDEDFPSFLK